MSKKDGPLWGLYTLIGICVLIMAGTVWYFMPHEGETIIQTGTSFGPYLFKGKIYGGIGPDTIVIEYNQTEYYYSSHSIVDLDKNHQYKIRFPDGPGIIILKVNESKEGSQ